METEKQNNLNQIKFIESKYNIKFPQSLFNYYLNYPESKIENVQFKLNGFLLDVAELISIKNDDKFSLNYVYNTGKNDGWIPDNFYPFAHDSGGNFYFWNSQNDKVFIIFNDDVDHPYVVCDSVDNFFKLLVN